MTALTSAILARLLKRRAAVQAQLDDILCKPASYSIQGSYSQTSQDADVLRDELRRIDSQIRRVRRGDGSGMTRIYPDYSNV